MAQVGWRVFTILSGLLTALLFATSDMLSQRVTRETRPLQQTLWVFATGAIIIVPVALVFEGLLNGLRVGDLGLVCALTSLQGAYVAIAAGALELSGIVFLSLAFTLGLPAVGGVTATQYGTFAVILGFVLLHERPRRHQWVGIVCTIGGVSLLAAIVWV